MSARPVLENTLMYLKIEFHIHQGFPKPGSSATDWDCWGNKQSCGSGGPGPVMIFAFTLFVSYNLLPCI